MRVLSLLFGLSVFLFLSSGVSSKAGAQPATTSVTPSATTRQILLLNSFELRPFTVYEDLFRTELGQRSATPVNVFKVSLQPAPFAAASEEEPIVNYLRSTLAGRHLDLVVSVGGPAAVFAEKYRHELFPASPLLQTALDSRWLREQPAVNSIATTAAAVALNPAQVVDDVLRLLPETRQLFVVVGSSRFEDFWRNQMLDDFERFKDRLTFVWTNDLSSAETVRRASALPPHSVILYTSWSEDGRGVLQSETQALAALKAAANAPVFGLFDFQLGSGIVGGPLLSVTELARHSVDVSLRLLNGESPATITTPDQLHAPPVYDWRELKRWSIGEARLPTGSTVQFRQPGLWDQYKFSVVMAIVLLGLQSALIAGLVVQRTRRRRVEHALRESESRFRLMANGAPVMVWTATPDMQTDFYNSTVLQFTGLSMEQLLGDGWLERVHPDDVEACTNSYVPAFAARRPFQMEYRFRRADGSYRWLLDAGVPRYDADGTFAGYIGSALDITERREMEQRNRDLAGRLINAQEAERTRIARDLHDDLSQQLAGVAIMLSGLKRTLAKSQAHADTQDAADRAVSTLQERTSALARSLRSLSHELHPSVLQHSGLVATLRNHCDEVAQHHRLAVTFRADGNLDALGPEVALCLFRVAQEALANAVRHARARTLDVQLAATLQDVALTVVDDGVGFVTVERTHAGLGLRSIDERVRLTGGNVHLQSQPGAGTRLVVRIPVGTSEVAAAAIGAQMVVPAGWMDRPQ